MENITSTSIQTIELNLDNLEAIPEIPALYAIFEISAGRSAMITCRFIHTTNNLRNQLKNHFNPFEPNYKLRIFMLSNKLKHLRFYPTYRVKEKTIENLYNMWIRLYSPDCNAFKLS